MLEQIHFAVVDVLIKLEVFPRFLSRWKLNFTNFSLFQIDDFSDLPTYQPPLSWFRKLTWFHILLFGRTSDKHWSATALSYSLSRHALFHAKYFIGWGFTAIAHLCQCISILASSGSLFRMSVSFLEYLSSVDDNRKALNVRLLFFYSIRALIKWWSKSIFAHLRDRKSRCMTSVGF